MGGGWRRAVIAALVAVGSLGAAVLPAAVAVAATTSSTSDAAGTEVLQRQLNALGCNAGTVDGTLGPNTIQAVRWFQTAAGLAVDGIIGVDTSGRLAQAAATGSPHCRSLAAPGGGRPNGAGGGAPAPRAWPARQFGAGGVHRGPDPCRGAGRAAHQRED